MIGNREATFTIAGVLLAAAVTAWLALLYGVSWHLAGGTSDNAAAVLAGRDMVHGNVLLHGWHLAADSFWLLDLPLLGFAAHWGLGPAVFHLVPTAVATATVLVAMRHAAWRMSRREAAVAAFATFLIIGLPSPLFASFFLQGPTHVVTVLCCLLGFGLLVPGAEFPRLAVGCFILLIAVAADPLALVIGVLPVVVAGVAVSRMADFRAGLSLVAAGVVAGVGGEGLVRAVAALGGFRRLPPLGFAARSRWVPNLHLAAHDFLYTFGVRVLPSWPYVAWPVRLVHVAGIALAGAAVTLAAIDLTRRIVLGRGRGTWIDDVCVLGFVGSVSFFVGVVFPGENVSRTRYLLPAMVFAAILAGRFASRVVGDVFDGVGARRAGLRAERGMRTVAVAVALVLLAGYGAETVASTRTTNPPNPAIALAAWLSAEHLTDGWGGYWDATVTTVASDEHVRVRPVIAVGGRLHAFGDLASDTWFSARSGRLPARFLVYQPRSPWGDVNLATATTTFGNPAERARVGSFEVLIWDRDTRAHLEPLVVR